MRILKFILMFLLLFNLLPSGPKANERTCRQLLNMEPLASLLTRNDEHDAGLIASDKVGEALLGSACDVESLRTYFFAAGWELTGQSEGYSLNGPPGDEYESDTVFAFCKPREFPRRMIWGYCGMAVGVSLHENRITHISAGLSK